MSSREQRDAPEELAGRHEAEPHPGGIMAEGVDGKLVVYNFSAEYMESIESLREDRNKWQARAKQAEGRASNLAKDLIKTDEQVADLQAQLEAAGVWADRSADLERVAAERDAAREEVRGLQVRVQQAEGDARQAAGKLGNLNGEVVRLKAQLTTKTDTLLRAEAAVDALRSVILDLFRKVRGDD